MSYLRSLRNKLSYANVMATAAFFLALTGTAFATGMVGSAQITDNSILSRDIHNGTVAAADMAKNSVASKQITNGSIAAVDMSIAAKAALAPHVAYALVYGNDGTVDGLQSSGISNANVTRSATGEYCFGGLVFTPTHATANIYANFFGGSVTIGMGTWGGCPNGTQLTAYTYNAAGVSTDLHFMITIG